MNEKVSITYDSKKGLILKIGKQVIPNSIIADPLNITLSSDGHRVKLDLLIDHLSISDVEAIAKYVRFE